MSADRAIVNGTAPGASSRILSVLVGRTYALDPRGGCDLQDGAFRLCSAPEYLEGIEYPGRIKPSLLRRDLDYYAFRNFTDLVVRGTVHADRPVKSAEVALTCVGPQVSIAQRLAITGDRQVERGPVGPRLSEAASFIEMPLRYDKAYGGTDELAEERGTDAELTEELAATLGEEVFTECGTFSYPRNPAGKGFLVEPESLLGLAWPNIELAEARLPTRDLERLAQPFERWGERPYPVGFDWISHDWFPRVAFFGLIPETHDGRIPAAEVELGLMRADEVLYPLADRVHRFAQGAHPYLCRHRLRGGEKITVTSLAKEGRDLTVSLPTHRPLVHLSLFGAKSREVDTSLDLVFVEGDERRLTLLWRATVPAGREHLPAEWEAQCPYRIEWT